jgi:acetylglutamate kinase
MFLHLEAVCKKCRSDPYVFLVDDRTRASLKFKEAQTLIEDGVIKGGMVAKMESAFAALNQNVPRVHIIQWQGPDTLRSIIGRKSTVGTIIQA